MTGDAEEKPDTDSMPPEARAEEDRHRPVFGLIVTLCFAALFAIGLVGLPRGDAPLPAIAHRAMRSALPVWKSTQTVSGVVYGSRAMDTFGETFLLLAAVVSVVVIARHREPRTGYLGEEEAGAREQVEDDPRGSADSSQAQARSAEGAEDEEEEQQEQEQEEEQETGGTGGEAAQRSGEIDADRDDQPDRPAQETQDESAHLQTPDRQRVGAPAPERSEATSVITRTAIRVVVPLLGVAGIYLFVQGYSPGGGFPAGVVMLGIILLAYAGYGHRLIAPVVRPKVLETIEMVVALILIVILTLGLPFAGSFSANWLPLGPLKTLRSGGTFQAFSIAEFFEVATGLTIAVFALLGMRHEWTPDEDDDSGGDSDAEDDSADQSAGDNQSRQGGRA